MAIDIDQSYYNTGTATVANGGTVVTGQGTQWTSSIRANDIFGTHKGDGVRILSVESNTSLTLAYPWQGDAQTAAAYEIQFTPYDTGYYPAVRQLLQTMTSGNVEALAALVGAPNRVPIFTGPGAMTLADPSTFGIQDPNSSLAKLAALTLAANKLLNTDANGDLALSDITTAAIALLNLAGSPVENSMPFFYSDTAAALTPLTLRARTFMAASTGAAMMTAMGGEVFGTVTNGGVIWPNGEMEQWGEVTTLDSGGGANITYPRAFGSISVFIPTLLTDWNSVNFTPVIYQSWDWGVDRRTGQVVWCRLINGTSGSGPLTVGNIRWYARGKA